MIHIFRQRMFAVLPVNSADSVREYDSTALKTEMPVYLRSWFSAVGYLGGELSSQRCSRLPRLACAICLLFLDLPTSLLVTGVVAAAAVMVLDTPFAAILLTVTVATANTHELGYIGLTTTTALVTGKS